MKFHNEYRDGKNSEEYGKAISQLITQPRTIIELCGGQTDILITPQIEELLPKEIKVIHGLGCHLRVIPQEIIDQAIKLATQPDIILACFENILQIPGTQKNLLPKNLLSVKAEGGNVCVVKNALDCVKIAQENPDKEIVFFAAGFENTVPASTMLIHQALVKKLKNFSVLVSHLLIPPAVEAIVSNPECPVVGFIGPSNINTVMGCQYYQTIAEKYHVPIVVTGSYPVDIMQGIYMCIQQLEAGEGKWQNQDQHCWHPQNNPMTQKLIEEVFEVVDRDWQHLGHIPSSGFGLRKKYHFFDAQKRYKSLLASANTTQSVEKSHQQLASEPNVA